MPATATCTRSSSSIRASPATSKRPAPPARRSCCHCIEVGGTITGEHGVGMEKSELMDRLFSADTLDAIRGFKLLFDPDNRLNPGKMLPTGKGCLEIRQPALSAASTVY